MAGRPRTTLKRINSWLQRVSDLHEEIIAHMPNQYKNPHPADWDDLAANVNPDKEDPIACGWTAVDRAGCDLGDELTSLASAIAERAGLEVYLVAPPEGANASAMWRNAVIRKVDQQPTNDDADGPETGPADDQVPAS